MGRKAAVIEQTTRKTVVKCPRCKRRIELHHQAHESGINDDTGRLDLGFQLHSSVVCMNKPNGRYCDFAGDLSAKEMLWC